MDRDRGRGAGRDGAGTTGEPGGCAAFGPLLEALYHHVLEAEQAQAVAEHAAECALCAATLERFRATDQLIASAPMPTPGPELRQRLVARIAVARAHRPAGTVTSMPITPITRETVVHDMNDMNDVNNPNDSEWTRTGTQATRTRRGAQRVRVWLGTVAAVLVVALLAGAFLTRMNGAPGQTSVGLSNFSPAKGTCAPGDIKAQLPTNSEFGSLAMVSPDEGWALGAVVDPANGDPVSSLILHYKNCTWTVLPTNYPDVGLGSISMDSATDGWAIGSTNSGAPFALHYTNGNWKQVTPPGESVLHGGAYSVVHMLSADEGWIVFNHVKDSHGLLTNGLLHLSNGHWSAVNAPFPVVEAVLPVAPNEVWIAGSASNAQESPVLYHYRAGTWSKATLPAGVLVDHLRMVSPNDIWASGHTIPPSSLVDQTAAVLHYDGTSWTRVSLGSAAQAPIVNVFNAQEGWAFTLTSTQKQPCQPGADYVISKVRFGSGAMWQTAPWPLKDLSYVGSLTRVAPDEYWAIGYYAMEKVTPTGNGGCSGVGYSVSVLLYFANGTWHEYGR